MMIDAARKNRLSTTIQTKQKGLEGLVLWPQAVFDRQSSDAKHVTSASVTKSIEA
jgi:hypothetical protein